MDSRRIEQLNNVVLRSNSQRFRGETVNASSLDDNITAIKKLIVMASASGILEVYRPLYEQEIAELSAIEGEAVANAYFARLDGKDYYITYKPSLERTNSSKLEHLNRSTAFVEALLNKISAEYSFLYCKSRVKNMQEYSALPSVAAGFRCEDSKIVKKGSTNKYELFFLIECLDNIDAAENLTNIIDSVLLGSVEDNRDAFANMSYARLERESGGAQDSASVVPAIDDETMTQLNGIITQIREQSYSRQKILDFIATQETSSLNKYFAMRNEVFVAANTDVNALNSTITCRILPIGVFLNEIENYSVTYSITAIDGGKKASFALDINPMTTFAGHKCPHCGALVTQKNPLVLSQGASLEVACVSCAVKCSFPACDSWTLKAKGCSVCGKNYCGKHSVFCADSGLSVCASCAQVFHDSKTGKALAPVAATLNGAYDDYVASFITKFGVEKALKTFATQNLRRKKDLVSCESPDGKFYYYEKANTRVCDSCKQSFYKSDVSPNGDEFLCFKDRFICSCGAVVDKRKTHKCSEDGCEQRFCDSCAPKEKLSYAAALKLISGSVPRGALAGGKVYCSSHVKLCKSCGAITPLAQVKKCVKCGGDICASCAKENDGKCASCAKAGAITAVNYKRLSSRHRVILLNKLSPIEKFTKKIAVLEDFHDIMYVNAKTGDIKVRSKFGKKK